MIMLVGHFGQQDKWIILITENTKASRYGIRMRGNIQTASHKLWQLNFESIIDPIQDGRLDIAQ
jgi:hypothetical protein